MKTQRWSNNNHPNIQCVLFGSHYLMDLYSLPFIKSPSYTYNNNPLFSLSLLLVEKSESGCYLKDLSNLLQKKKEIPQQMKKVNHRGALVPCIKLCMSKWTTPSVKIIIIWWMLGCQGPHQYNQNQNAPRNFELWFH